MKTMTRRDEPKKRGELRRRLERWRGVVERYARGLRADPRKYAAAHGQLLQYCRKMAQTSGEEQKIFYEEVEQVVRPWINVQALIQADKELLVEMLQRCRKAEYELGGGPWLKARLHWRRPVLMVLAGGVSLAILAWATMRWWLLLKSTFKGARLQITLALDRLGVIERWMVGGTIAIIVAMFLLSRTAKS
jgi:hypothetical protein